MLNGLLQLEDEAIREFPEKPTSGKPASETQPAKRAAMIAIILSTCLVSDPSVCRDQKIPLSSEISPVRCMMTAPPHVAQWSEAHPQ